MDSSLRDRLSAVARSRGAPAPAAAGVAPPRAPARPRKIPPLDRILPGEARPYGGAACWVHTRAAAGWPTMLPTLSGRLERALQTTPADLEQDAALLRWRTLGLAGGVFLDLETTGLAGVPIFLAGLLSADATGALEFRLYLARDYREEAALVAAVAGELARHPVAVTYNGKSYDIPTLRERAARLRVPFPAEIPVLDLLHAARRRWAGRFADCRLSTLERHLCGRPRSGDIPGAEIPAAYHRFVQDGDPRPLLRVFHHNLMDLHTLAEVTAIVMETEIPPPAPVPGSDR